MAIWNKFVAWLHNQTGWHWWKYMWPYDGKPQVRRCRICRYTQFYWNCYRLWKDRPTRDTGLCQSGRLKNERYWEYGQKKKV